MTTQPTDNIVEDQSLDIDLTARDENPFLLPAGNFLVIVKSATKKFAKTSTDSVFVEAKLEVLEGPHKGISIIDRMHIKNPKQTAMRMGQNRLRQLAIASGLTKLTKTADLVTNRPLSVDVIVSKNSNPQFDDSNNVARYSATGGSVAPAQAGAEPTSVVGWNPTGAVDPDAV